MKKLYVSLLFLALTFSAFTAHALNVQTFRPGTGQVEGFTLFTSDLLPKNQFTYGLGLNYVINPLEVGSSVTNRVTGLVDDVFTADVLMGYGLTDWLNINVDIPVQFYTNVAPIFIASRDSGFGGMGDIYVTLPIRLWDAEQTASHLGLSIIPEVTIPTGNGDNYVGDDSATGGVTVAGDWKFGDNRLYANVGTKFRKDETISNLGADHEMTYGLGYQRPISKAHDWNMIIEGKGSTKYKDYLSEEITTPLEVFGVIQKKWMDESLVLNVGGSRGITGGYGSPDFRAFSTISYSFPVKHKKKPAAAIKEKVLFPFDNAVYYPEYEANIDRIANFWKANKDIYVKLSVAGHTDAKGSNQYNDELSIRRAKTVAKALIARGVPSDKIIVSTFGENTPVAPNELTDGKDNPDGRQQNRRVEITLLKKE